MIRYRKMNRRSIGLCIGPAGVEVRLPWGVNIRDEPVQAIIAQQLAAVADQAPPEASPAFPLSRETLRTEIDACSTRMGVSPARVQVRPMAAKWGSCSSRGNISLSDRILLMPPTLREYLICHELAHLRYMNHGADFKKFLLSAVPDWRKRQDQLSGWIAAQVVIAVKQAASQRVMKKKK